MAAFTDQFSRRDALTFEPGYAFRGRLAVAVDEARGALIGRDVAEFVAIAMDTSAIVDRAALHLGRVEDHRTGGDWYDPSLEGDMAAQAENELNFAEMFRDDLGELGVYLTADFSTHRDAIAQGAVRFERWESLAVMSLWLAMDCLDELQGRARPASSLHPGYRPATLEELFPEGVPENLPGMEDEVAIVLALDSMRASALAVEGRQRSADRAAMRANGVHAEAIAEMEKRDEAVRAALSERSKTANDARRFKKQPLVDKAIEIANSRPFYTWVDVVDAIEDHVPKTPDGTKAYNPDTIVRWLKNAGWQPAPRPAGKG